MLEICSLCFYLAKGAMGCACNELVPRKRSTSWTACLHVGFDDSALLQAQTNWKPARTCPEHFFLDEPIRWFSFVHWHLMNVFVVLACALKGLPALACRSHSLSLLRPLPWCLGCRELSTILFQTQPWGLAICSVVRSFANGVAWFILVIPFVSFAAWSLWILLFEFHLCARTFQHKFLLSRQWHDTPTRKPRKLAWAEKTLEPRTVSQNGYRYPQLSTISTIIPPSDTSSAGCWQMHESKACAAPTPAHQPSPSPPLKSWGFDLAQPFMHIRSRRYRNGIAWTLPSKTVIHSRPSAGEGCGKKKLKHGMSQRWHMCCANRMNCRPPCAPGVVPNGWGWLGNSSSYWTFGGKKTKR